MRNQAGDAPFADGFHPGGDHLRMADVAAQEQQVVCWQAADECAQRGSVIGRHQPDIDGGARAGHAARVGA
jgi:hypothetical protein